MAGVLLCMFLSAFPSIVAREIPGADDSAEPEIFADLLLTENDPLPFDARRGRGFFARVDGDWIVCRPGEAATEPPAGHRFHLSYSGKVYDDIARFNNEAVDLALRSVKEPSLLAAAEKMLRAGYAEDTHFFAFNYNLARLLRLRRAFDEALIFAERSAAMLPGDSHLHLVLAAHYERRREDIAAHQHYRMAVRTNPFAPLPLLELANFYRRTDRESLAEDILRRGMDRFETDPVLRLGLGELRMRQKLYGQARVLFESIDLFPEDRSVFALRLAHRMAQLYDRTGDYRRSRLAYDRLLADTGLPYFLDLNIAALERERERVRRLSSYE